MKFHKEIKINLGNYQSLLLGCSDAESFDEIDKAIIKEIKEKDIEVNGKVKEALNMV